MRAALEGDRHDRLRLAAAEAPRRHQEPPAHRVHRIVQLLVYLVIVPTVMMLGVGIVLMLRGERYNLVFGILTVAFVSAVATGVILVIVFVRREANLSALQADFVSKVSHELRTPLTAIRLFAETIERSKDEKTRHECTLRLISESERLGGRIDRLLDWGRMEAGRKLYDLREEAVKPIVADERPLSIARRRERRRLRGRVGARRPARPGRSPRHRRHAAEPPHQRAEVRRVPAAREAPRLPGARRPGDPRSERQRRRHRSLGASPHLREVLPDRRPPLADARRVRPGAGDREASPGRTARGSRWTAPSGRATRFPRAAPGAGRRTARAVARRRLNHGGSFPRAE